MIRDSSRYLQGVGALLVMALTITGLSSCAAQAPLSPEDAFVAELEGVPGTQRFREDADLIAYGRRVCDQIGAPDMSRLLQESLLDSLLPMPSDPGKPGAQVIDAANAHLCPGKTYAIISPAEHMIVVPDLSGMTGDEAMQATSIAGILDVRFKQDGGSTSRDVVRQEPAPGTQQKAGDEVFIELEPSRAERNGF